MAQRDNFSISCQNCTISQLCLPFTLNGDDLTELDNIIERKKPYQRGQELYGAGQPLKALYAVRSGSFKVYSISNQGEQQIIGFYLPGDVIGFDALRDQRHRNYAEALETAMVCEIPYHTLDTLSGQLPKLRQQVMRMMSNEIQCEQDINFVLNKRNAEQRLAFFLSSLSQRFAERGLSARSFRLSMTRSEIGNYLGLTIETVSRLITRFQQQGMIAVEGKLVNILDPQQLQGLVGEQVLNIA